ncbi:MAG: STAS domain-containing protein [Phycisphaerales bacterium]|nr:MAG: STAS domain-containing protein [Phycisphaerales bacterium]
MNEAEEILVQSETIDDAVVMRPVGDIDLGRAPSLRVQLAQVQQRRPARLIIDLEQVPYMDSSGVATLVEAMQTARRADTKLVLCSMQEKVRSIFEIARLDMVFTIVGSQDEAMSA